MPDEADNSQAGSTSAPDTGKDPLPKTPPMVALGFERTVGVVEFYSVEDLLSWLDAEAAAWNWLASLDRSKVEDVTIQLAKSLYTHLTSHFTSVTSILRTNPDWPKRHQKVDLRLNSLVSESNSGRLILTGTPRFQFIETLRRADTFRAVWAAALLSGHALPPGEHLQRVAAEVDVGLFLTGRGDEAISAHDQSFLAMQQRWTTASSEATRAVLDLNNDRADARTALNTVKEEFETERKELKGALEKELDAVRKKYDEDIQAIRNAVEVEFRLKGPVKYWTKSAADNSTNAWIALAAAVGILIAPPLVVGLLHSYVGQWLGVDKIDGVEDYWRFGPAIVATFLYIWCLRIAFRVYLSFKHVAAESELRANWAQVYAALISEKSIERDSKTVATLLEAMFRPVSTGLNNGEQPPPTPHTIIQNALDAQKD